MNWTKGLAVATLRCRKVAVASLGVCSLFLGAPYLREYISPMSASS